MNEFPPPLPSAEIEAFKAKRRGRNLAMLVAFLVFAAVFYAIAMVKMAKSL